MVEDWLSRMGEMQGIHTGETYTDDHDQRTESLENSHTLTTPSRTASRRISFLLTMVSRPAAGRFGLDRKSVADGTPLVGVGVTEVVLRHVALWVRRNPVSSIVMTSRHAEACSSGTCEFGFGSYASPLAG